MPKYVVRHGATRQLGVFASRGSDQFSRGHRVIARTARGLEAGEVLCEATPHVVSQMADSRNAGQILRLMTHDDDVELRKLQQQQHKALTLCAQRVRELGLDMQMVDVEHLYGGERVVFYYLSEARIDFRELVKLLAKDFQTRIEMRQIGVRDEAKLLADYGDCGKPVCCNTHLAQMPPVSMKMAKLQKATLDPTKISGRCGRLKCCLRYEYDTYRELQKDLPRIGAEVITETGRAKVLAHEVLASQLLVETEDGRRLAIDLSQVLSVVGRPASADRPSDAGTEANDYSSHEDPSGEPGPSAEGPADHHPTETGPRRGGGGAQPSPPAGAPPQGGRRRRGDRERRPPRDPGPASGGPSPGPGPAADRTPALPTTPADQPPPPTPPAPPEPGAPTDA